jgi:cystathionine beta-synthase
MRRQIPGTEIASSMLDLIGETPIVAMGNLTRDEGISATLAVKHEVSNPGGSAKDRPAMQMILDAEASGELRPGGTIVEPTSGNTGVGLAIVAAQRGYKCVFVTTDKVAPEKIALLRAYGAEVVVCPIAVAPEDERSYYQVAASLTLKLGAYRPNQYANPSNPKAHELTTGPEIWRQTGGKITHFVAGAGTSGTITGTARYLLKQNPEIQIIVADPDRSVFSGGSGRPYLVEGVGEDFYPAAWQPDLYDEIIPVSDMESFTTARRVAAREGLLLGGSGGLAMTAALRVAKRCSTHDLIVVLNPDSGRGYLSRVYDDGWMARNGFLTMNGSTVAEIVNGRSEMIYVHEYTPVREAIVLMEEHGISQLPVCQAEPPFAPAEIRGAVHETTLLLHGGGEDWLERPVGEIMKTPMPYIGIGESTQRAAELMEDSNAAIVLEGGRSRTVLTRSDLLRWYEKRRRA